MRQIKFRVWDTDKQRFIWTGFENFLSETHEDKPQDVRQGRMVLNADWAGMGSRCVFQQFVGIKDKNGKEIYEGDIVNQEKWVSVGKYAPSTGVVKYKSVGFTCECIGDWFGSNADLNGNAEIIGNIYENPELLGK